MNLPLNKTCPLWWIYKRSLKDIFSILNIVIITSHVCLLISRHRLLSVFLCFLNCEVSLVYSLTGDSDLWLICCLDNTHTHTHTHTHIHTHTHTHTSWADNESNALSDPKIFDQRNNQQIWSKITPVLGEYVYTIIYIYIYIYINWDLTNPQK